jgi:hypothetical protein
VRSPALPIAPRIVLEGSSIKEPHELHHRGRFGKPSMGGRGSVPAYFEGRTQDAQCPSCISPIAQHPVVGLTRGIPPLTSVVTTHSILPMAFLVASLSAIPLLVALWSLCLPLYLDIVLVLVSIFLAYKARRIDLVILTCSTVFAITAVHAAFSAQSGFIKSVYREHEKYVQGGYYRARVNDTIEMPHGDLVAVDPTVPLSIAERRTVHFQTDSTGFRNPSDYSNEKIILSGDSFVVGNGTDYEQTLPALLRSRGFQSYSIAHPSDPVDYEKRAADFTQAHRDMPFQILTFYYEGNDFTVQDPIRSKPPPSLVDRYFEQSDEYDQFRRTILRQVPFFGRSSNSLTGMRQRLERSLAPTNESRVHVFNLFNHAVGFIGGQSAFSFATQLSLMPTELSELVLGRSTCVFLIPTKIRTYSWALPRDIQDSIPWPPPAHQALVESYKGTTVKVVDLTPALVSEAKRLSHTGEFVFWRDDTHWNGHGMRAVLPQIIECLESTDADQ